MKFLFAIRYGGAKGGVRVDPLSLSRRELEAISRRYMQEMIPFVGPRTDIMAPDMGTDEQVMAWFMDTYSMYRGHAVSEIVTGKPVASGGTVGHREATGRGIVHLTRRACDCIGLSITQTRAIIQGFGNVGKTTADLLDKCGAKIVGMSDHTAAYYDIRGLDMIALDRHLASHGVLKGFSTELLIDPKELLIQDCDILIPAAVERTIDESVAARIKCRILTEGANGPTTPAADAVLRERNQEIFVLPDILANAGGVIVSYFEWVQGLQQFFWDENEVNQRLFSVMDRAFDAVLKRAVADKVTHRRRWRLVSKGCAMRNARAGFSLIASP